jgi:hypothetical protein
MNVAISRAKSVCYLVYSTNLPKAVFSSLEDVRGISRLAGLLGMAKESGKSETQNEMTG